MTKRIEVHTMSYSERCMLSTVNVNTWTGRIIDRNESRDVNDRRNASRDAARVRKHLLAGADKELRAVHASAAAWRVEHKRWSLPWGESERIITNDLFFDFMQAMSACESRHTEAVDAFFNSYPQRCTEAQRSLGGLYASTDYPDATTLRGRFNARHVIYPFPDAATDWRVDIDADQLNDLKQRAADDIAQRISESTRDLWDRLAKVIEHAHARLKDPDATFRDSLVTNVRDTIDRIGKLNIANDVDLNATIGDVAARIAAFDADTLRDDKQTRESVSDAAADVIRKMRGYMS